MLKKETQTNKKIIKWLPRNRSASSSQPKLVYFGLRFKQLLKTKYFLITTILLLFFLLAFGLVFSISLNKTINRLNITLIYVLEILALSIFNITLAIYCIWKLFYDDNNDGVTKLEARIGLQKPFMYFYRLGLLTILSASFLIIEYAFLAIFYAIAYDKHQIFAYRLFISPFSWLAFISFFTIFISLFITTIFQSRFTIVFATIISIGLLFISSISGNFISNKVQKSNQDNVVLNKPSQADFEQMSFFPWELDDATYLSLGFKFNNHFNFYQSLKIDNQSLDGYQILNFCREIYNNNLSDEENINLFTNAIVKNTSFQSLNEKLVKINDLYIGTEDDELLVKSLYDTRDFILVKYSEILSRTLIYNASAKFEIVEDIRKLQKDFFNYTFNSFLVCEAGIKVDTLEFNEINLISKFNSKIKKNTHLNPFYQLNLMLFGNGYNSELDNIINYSRPLFNQALNTSYHFQFEEVQDSKDPTDRPRQWIHIRFTQANQKPTIKIGVLVTINVLVFVTLSVLMYFGYKIRK